MAIDKPFKIGNLAYTLARQLLVKDKGGIASLPDQGQILSKVQDIFQMLKAGGYNPVSADKSIKNVNDLKKVLTDIEMKQQIEFNLSKNRSEGLETVLKKMDEGIPLNPGDQAKVEGVEKLADDEVLDAFKGFKPKIIQGGKSEGIEKLLKSGDIKKGVAPKTKTKDYKKIVELEEENMLADEARAKEFSDFSNRIKGMSSTDRVAERLKDLKGVNLSDLSGIEAQKIASEVIGRKGPFKTISSKGAKEVLGELEPIIKRADAEVDLGTKLKNFDGDPDAMAMGGRIGFDKGSPPSKGRRNFLKLLGGLASIPVFGKLFKAAKPAAKVAEVAKEVTSGVPAYFPKLVEKIKMLGDDVTEIAATKERQKVTKYKDYELTEEIDTGAIQVKKGDIYAGKEEYMIYDKPETIVGKNNKPVEVPAQYEEVTVKPDMDGKMKDVDAGLDSISDIMKDADMIETNYKIKPDGRPKKSGGGVAYMLGE